MGLHKISDQKERICHRKKHHDDSEITAREVDVWDAA